MSLSALVLLFAGLILLIAGAELLVKGSSRLAAGIGISPLVIGLTVVAFGTSAPELAVSISSALSPGEGSNIALGNVVGSNIFNILFILGISSAISPLFVSQQLIRKDVPIMIAISILLLGLCIDGKIGRIDGIILFAGILAYTFFAIKQGKSEPTEVESEYQNAYGIGSAGRKNLLNVIYILSGLAALVIGARWLVHSAVEISIAFGVSDLIIGLTIVAAGTSLPEVATSVMAAIKGERDIAVGNVVGSNIFNILAVTGLSAVIAPSGLNAAQSVTYFDIPFMTAVAFACLPVFFTGLKIARWEGMVFVGYYIAYSSYLILKAKEHDSLAFFSDIMLIFVIPITVITLLITVIFERRIRLRGNE